MVDRVKILIRSGNGGDGLVHFHRAKFQPKGGPDGGDGGKGGSLYIIADANLSTLDDFAHRQKFEAGDGQVGGSTLCSGSKGEDLTIKVPVGTYVKLVPMSSKRDEKGTDRWEVRMLDFDKEGMIVKVAKGGAGGKGNYHFRSATNQTPQESTPGEKSIWYEAHLDLKLLADVGLVGLPNVGKSTLLSVLSNARPKIADYPFTTLEPNLGVADVKGKKIVIADIPGLIEGASEGKGLGVKFLQHVERTKVLVHILSGGRGPHFAGGYDGARQRSAVSEEIWNNYKVVRKELENFAQELGEKKELVVLNKIELMDEDEVKKAVTFFKKKKINLSLISCGTMVGIEELRGKIAQMV